MEGWMVYWGVNGREKTEEEGSDIKQAIHCWVGCCWDNWGSVTPRDSKARMVYIKGTKSEKSTSGSQAPLVEVIHGIMNNPTFSRCTGHECVRQHGCWMGELLGHTISNLVAIKQTKELIWALQRLWGTKASNRDYLESGAHLGTW